MKSIRVLQFITPSGFYGAERWILALANNSELSSVEHELAVTKESPTQDLRVAELYPRDAGEVHYIPSNGRFDMGVVKRLVEMIRKRKIDVIHTHGYKSDILGFMAAKISGIKCVSTPHGFSGNVGPKLRAFIWLGTKFFRFFDAVAPLSPELVEDMKRFGVMEEKIHLILNGVDLKEIDNMESYSRKEEDVDSKIIGFVGQLIPRKGLKDLIDTFDELYRNDDKLQLRIVGDGRQREELEAYANRKMSASSISFLGFRSDRLALLSECDLFVMTSSLEGIPRCLMEAMALGVPVVAYDIFGVRDLVEHRKTGLLVKHGDKKGLVEQCGLVLYDPELEAELAGSARQKISEQYSAARMASEYERLFREVINGPSSVNQKRDV